jgi:glycosyltransferase involved in cell wall biosynthesis
MGDMYEELKERSSSYENIFLRGNATAEMLPVLLKETAFGIIPLRNIKLNHSTCPIKLFDYWCARKAVIATPMNEIKAVAEDNVIYASGKTEFVNAINYLLKNSELRNDMGKRGYELVISTYNYDRISDRFLKILEQ